MDWYPLVKCDNSVYNSVQSYLKLWLLSVFYDRQRFIIDFVIAACTVSFKSIEMLACHLVDKYKIVHLHIFIPFYLYQPVSKIHFALKMH